MQLDYHKENIDYYPGVYGEAKVDLMHAASVFVLPSYSENFGNVIAEALASGCPVMTTTGTPWNEIERYDCGKYIVPDQIPLTEALYQMYCTPPEVRLRMGMNGREYVRSNFDWDVNARRLFGHLANLAKTANLDEAMQSRKTQGIEPSRGGAN
jgi:glycosyltransferase involved in cell wall biosynthesis